MARGRAAAARESCTILVVEDDRDLLMVLGILLDFERYSFIAAEDGLVALGYLASHRPALVILDWLLPKVGGGRVLTAIRERYGGQVPVLVLSAVADAEEVRAAGADAYLSKPYAIEDLVAAITGLLTAPAPAGSRRRRISVVPR